MSALSKPKRRGPRPSQPSQLSQVPPPAAQRQDKAAPAPSEDSRFSFGRVRQVCEY